MCGDVTQKMVETMMWDASPDGFGEVSDSIDRGCQEETPAKTVHDKT